MRLSRALKSKIPRNIFVIGFFSGLLIFFLYTEMVLRKRHEEEVLVGLENLMKEDAWRVTTSTPGLAHRKQTEIVARERDEKTTGNGVNHNGNQRKVKRIVRVTPRKQKQLLMKGKKKNKENCFDFKEDRPNWTIKFRHNVSQICLQKKYHPKWVKRIILANKTAIYRGCTRQTHRCGHAPYFDSKLNKRINTPPCCLKHIVEIFRNFDYLIREYGGRYFLFGGGLIGWFRNRSIVPYDHDLDVIVAMDFWRSTRFKLFLNELKTKKGYHIKWLSWNKIKIYYSERNHNFIDLWPFSRKGKDKVRIKSRMWKVHNVSHILPLKRSKFEGFAIWVPRDPSSALTVEYGDGWSQELTCKKIGKYGNCKE